MNDEEDKGSGVQVISRVAKILRTLGDHPDGLSLGEIASKVSLPKSTVKRLVSALEAEQIIQTMGVGGITFGAGLLKLLAAANVDGIKALTPWLQTLGDELNETIVLSRAHKFQLLILHRIIADRQLQVIPRLGAGELLLCTSSAGRALLSLETDGMIIEALRLSKLSPEELNRDHLLQQITEIREKGYALDHGEIMEGITTIAIAVTTIFGKFAISIPLPSFRFQPHAEQYINQLLSFKCKVEKALTL